ncbi:type I restriction-modification system subunit M [Mycoplasma sp. E35C]|uniref:type I restriction-modification system subunit M n=1 Tax=Mycoplasma sp. E35C TaxID=2801918 RepID=UPI001CA3D7DC|nr:type I restriction-modification system subunit M [Mycoplasma sp. E35C]QZX49324.1 type I restriction-modification system subunit M [Mycoplasma sp. E35C]
MTKEANKALLSANKERDSIHKTIWNIADELRGAVDGSEFKNYVLAFMFYRFISEHIENYIDKNEHEIGDVDFSYALLKDSGIDSEFKKSISEELGFFILPSQLFSNVKKSLFNEAAGGGGYNLDNLNEKLTKVFRSIQKSSSSLTQENNFTEIFGEIELDSNKLGNNVLERNKRIKTIIDKISSMDFSYLNNNSVDGFGDAYEFLISMYASTAGKSGGEFFTPQEVSELLVRLATVDKKKIKSIYDPACGSGSLLLQANKVLGKNKVRDGFYGQEINHTTQNLCKMNMFLHGVAYDSFSIAYGNTLTQPYNWNKKFEVIVSNPPYSVKWEGDSNPILINDERFAPAGVLAPKNNADMAFIMHSLSSLSDDGVAAIVCFPGIFYRKGSEEQIRKYLVDNNFIDAIIQLPENLFFGTSTPTNIMVLNKNKKHNDIFFLNASNQFIKVGKKNKLSFENIKNIVDLYTERKKIKFVCTNIPNSLVKEGLYDLTTSKYIETKIENSENNIEQINKYIIQNEKEKKQLINDVKEAIERFKKNDCLSVSKKDKILNLCSIKRGKKLTKDKDENGKYKFFTCAKEELKINSCPYDCEAVLITGAGNGNTGQIKYYKGEFDCQLGVIILSEKKDEKTGEPKTNILLKYLYYYLDKKFHKYAVKLIYKGIIAHLNNSDVGNFEVLVPSIEKQKEIVEILDPFANYIKNLEKEIELRKLELEYYQNQLLTFDE